MKNRKHPEQMDYPSFEESPGYKEACLEVARKAKEERDDFAARLLHTDDPDSMVYDELLADLRPEYMREQGGTKYDTGKLRLDLITPEMTRALGETLTYGSVKYGDRNWEKGLSAGRVLGAAKRHMLSWEEGELIDPETGLSHLKHALTNLAFLVTLESRNKLKET